MAWLKVDDGFYDHPKVDDLSLEAVGLWLLCATYSSKHLTGGFVSRTRVARFGGIPSGTRSGGRIGGDSVPDDTRSNPVDELVQSGLLYEVGEGYQFHDWDAYNPSAEEAKARREDMSDGGREGNHRRWHVSRGIVDPDCGWCKSSPIGSSGSDRVPDSGADSGGESSRPVPSPSIAQAFEAFWSEYPKKVAKKAALKKFETAINSGVDPARIIESAKLYAQSVEGTERKFIKQPDGWLNAGRWDDEIELPPTGTEGVPTIWDQIQPRQNED